MTARPPDRDAGRADPSLPALLPLLLEPAGACPAERETRHRDLDARVPRGGRSRRAAASPLGRRARLAPRPGGAGADRARGGALHQPHHLRHRPDRTAAGGARRGRVSITSSSRCRAPMPRWRTSSAAIAAGSTARWRSPRWIGRIGFPLTLNAVVHRRNMHQLPRAIEMAVEMGARRIEVATVQFHGWAMKNRGALMPTPRAGAGGRRIVQEARERLKGAAGDRLRAGRLPRELSQALHGRLGHRPAST